MDQLVQEALDLLPASGDVLFEAYKAQLNAKLPNNAKDIFTYILKNGLLKKRLVIGDNHQVQLYLSRKA